MLSFLHVVVLPILSKIGILATGIGALWAAFTSVRGATTIKAELEEHHEKSLVINSLAAIETLTRSVGKSQEREKAANSQSPPG